MKTFSKILSPFTLALLVSTNAFAQDPAFNFLLKLQLFLMKLAIPAGIVAVIFGVFSVWLAIEQRSYALPFKICVGVAIIAAAPALVNFFIMLGI